MRTKFKAWAEPYLNEHPEISLGEEELSKLDNFYLEIGSGKGEFLAKMATNYPELMFIGIEKNVTCSGFTAKKLVEQKIKNAKLLWNDAIRVTPLFKDGSVNVIFLNFSDPWPKVRHHKRRLTSDIFIKEYLRILKKDGRLVFKSDNPELFAFSIDHLEEDSFDTKTEYEAYFNEEGTPIHRLVAVKND